MGFFIFGKLRRELELLRSQHHLATKYDLKEMEERIMSKISEFAVAQNAFNDQQDSAIAGLQEDILNLNSQIATLQVSAGSTITPEDQATLDALQARGKAIADKLTALDALTPPVPPATS